jgi:hypothetical protein
MILFISDPREDYQDSIFYAFKKTFGSEVVVYDDKPNYFEPYPETYRNCHYGFERSEIIESDILEANRLGTLKAIFIIASGYDVHSTARPLLRKLLLSGKKWPLVIIDGADDDRIHYNHYDTYPCDFDAYFKRELHMGIRNPEEGHDKRQIDAINNIPHKVHPLPFCIIPEKFPKRPTVKKSFNAFFRCGNVSSSKNRYSFMHDFNYPNSLIDLYFSNTPIHSQDRFDYFNAIDSSKVNLNLLGGGNDCYRFWEILGCGGFVLSQGHDQIIEPDFTPGENCDIFMNKQEMYDKIDFYCKNDAIREKIALNGYNFVMNNHTCYHRLKFIIDIINRN